jgi:hypothetical protein
MTEQVPPQHRVAGKLAQLLGETIIHHSPITAKIGVDETRRQVDEWLDGWEAHTAKFVGPVLQMVLDNSDPPPAVKSLLEEAITPTAAFSSTLEQIFLWGIISAVVGDAISPFLVEVTNQLNSAAVGLGIARAVDPSTLATAAGRGFDLGQAPTVTVPSDFYGEAAKSGVSGDELNLLASLVGLPPALQELFEMQRRGIIDSDMVAKGLREGDFRDDWIQYTTQLVHAWLTPLDFVRAAVQEQMTYADAQTWAQKTGLDTTTALPVASGDSQVTPDMFGLAFAIAGRPPGPEELARAANRGVIDWTGRGAGETTFEQGIAESDVKTKWTPILQALAVYVPPPRQVGTLLEHGAITEAQALQYWIDGGVPDALAQGYLYMTQQEHVGQDKLLAKGEITTAYYDGILSNADATTMLGLLGYRDSVAAQILATVDFRREIRAVNSVVTKIGTYYQSFRLTATNALQALENVGLSSEQAGQLVGTWDQVRVQPLRVPSASDIGKAYQYKTITQQEGLDALSELGYQPRDAAIVLSANSEQQVTPLPEPGTTTTG